LKKLEKAPLFLRFFALIQALWLCFCVTELAEQTAKGREVNIY
jgi:hypothetical protein